MIGGFPNERSRIAYHRVYDDLLDWPVPSEDLSVETRFGPTFVRRSGDGDGTPLVLLHGVLVTSLSWQRYVAGLGEGRPVYAIDSMGEPGRSVQTRPMPDAQANAGWLADVLAGLGHDRYHLVGISRGGWLALNLASRNPRHVAGVTAFDPGGLAEIRLRQRLWLWGGLAVLLSPSFVRRRLGDSPYRAFADPAVRRLLLAQLPHRTKVFLLDRFTDDQWRSLTVPARLVLAGRSFLHDSAEVRERLGRLAPGIRVEIVEDVSHDMSSLEPAAVCARILEDVT